MANCKVTDAFISCVPTEVGRRLLISTDTDTIISYRSGGMQRGQQVIPGLWMKVIKRLKFKGVR